MNNPDEQDDLWRLLGKARPPKVSPFFSRDVLREVRGLKQEQPGAFTALLAHWRLVLGGACAALVALVLVSHFYIGEPDGKSSDPLAAIAGQVSESTDYDVIGNLDELLAIEENSVWLESSPR